MLLSRSPLVHLFSRNPKLRGRSGHGCRSRRELSGHSCRSTKQRALLRVVLYGRLRCPGAGARHSRIADCHNSAVGLVRGTHGSFRKRCSSTFDF